MRIADFYREKVSIPKTLPFVTFLGNSSDPPTITGNATASATGSDGKPLKTFQSATVAVDANYFVAINMKFEVNLLVKLCYIAGMKGKSLAHIVWAKLPTFRNLVNYFKTLKRCPATYNVLGDIQA